MNSPTPVMIVLYDSEERPCYWSQFNLLRTEPSRRGWKITIPKRQVLSEDSKEELLNIVGPAAEYGEAAKAHWAMNETMGAFDSIHYVVDRKDIESGNTVHLEAFVRRISYNDMLCRRFQGRVELSISGYNQDPRELFEIAEVVRWYEKADLVFKYWFFFLSNEPPALGLLAYWSCMCSAKRTSESPKELTIPRKSQSS